MPFGDPFQTPPIVPRAPKVPKAPQPKPRPKPRAKYESPPIVSPYRPRSKQAGE